MVVRKILSLPRSVKRLIVLSVDLLILPLALWASFSLRLGEFYVPKGEIIYLFLATPAIAIPIFIRFGLYRLGVVAHSCNPITWRPESGDSL